MCNLSPNFRVASVWAECPILICEYGTNLLYFNRATVADFNWFSENQYPINTRGNLMQPMFQCGFVSFSLYSVDEQENARSFANRAYSFI